MKTKPIQMDSSANDENNKIIFTENENLEGSDESITDSNKASLLEDEELLHNKFNDAFEVSQNFVVDDDESIFIQNKDEGGEEVEDYSHQDSQVICFESGSNHASLDKEDDTIDLIYQCDECDYMTKIKSNLSKHKISHKEDRPYECDKTPNRSKKRKRLTIHEVVQEEEMTKLMCDECDFETDTLINLEQHYRRYHENRTLVETFLCQKCDYQTKNKILIENHMQLHIDHTQEGNDEDLDYKSMYKSELNELRKSHTLRKTYKCKKCPFKSASQDGIEKHESLHTNTKPYRCTKCPFRAMTNFNLNRHRSLVHGQMPLYRCHECSFSTTTEAYLQKHQSIHSQKSAKTHNGHYQVILNDQGMYRYACLKCNYVSKFIGNIKKHQVIHSKMINAKVENKPSFSEDAIVLSETPNELSENGQDQYQQPAGSGDEDDNIQQESESNVLTLEADISDADSHGYSIENTESEQVDEECAYQMTESIMSEEIINTEEEGNSSITSVVDNTTAALLQQEEQNRSARFFCDKCDYRAEYPYQINHHQISHSDYRPYQCDRCSYSAKTENYLRLHLTRRHKSVFRKCTKCPFTASAEDEMRLHFKNVHKIILPKPHIMGNVGGN